MGLDISHDTWHGAYSSFMRWREKIAEVAGYPALKSMDGFGGNNSWEPYSNDPLTELLYHSDCDGEINFESANKIADSLELLLPLLEGQNGGGHIGDYVEKTKEFIAGCKLAYSLKENLEFQ